MFLNVTKSRLTAVITTDSGMLLGPMVNELTSVLEHYAKACHHIVKQLSVSGLLQLETEFLENDI